MIFNYFLKRQHTNVLLKLERYAPKFKELQYKPSELIKSSVEVDAAFKQYSYDRQNFKGKLNSFLPWKLEYTHRIILATRINSLRNEIDAAHERALIINAENKPRFSKPVKSKSLDYDLPKKKTQSINQTQDDANYYRKNGKYSLGFFSFLTPATKVDIKESHRYVKR